MYYMKKMCISVTGDLAITEGVILKFRKGLEEKSSLSKERRESSVGERRCRRVREDGLGAAGSI